MNKLQFLALSALVVTAGVIATSCSSDEVVVENNPTFDGKAVKTDFAINIPVAGGKTSRQSVEVTQAETPPLFKGMKDIYLASMVDAVPTGNSVFTSVFRLPEIAKSEGITAANSAKIYNNVEVPVGDERLCVLWHMGLHRYCCCRYRESRCEARRIDEYPR